MNGTYLTEPEGSKAIRLMFPERITKEVPTKSCFSVGVEVEDGELRSFFRLMRSLYR